MKKTFIATFVGRKINAIGRLYEIETEVIAETTFKARLNLYRKYEHIGRLKLTEKTI